MLSRWGVVNKPTFANFADAENFALGLLHASTDHEGCIFVLDTDPEFASATLMTLHGPGQQASFKEEIKQLYDGVLDGTNYAANLVKDRKEKRNLAAKREASEREAGVQLAIFAVVAVVLFFIFFR